MDVRCVAAGNAAWKAGAVLVFVFEEDAATLLDAEASRLPKDLLDAAPWLGIAPALRDFKAAKGDGLMVYGHPEQPIPRVFLAGLGPKARLDSEARLLEAVRRAAGAALRRCRELGVETVGVTVTALEAICHAGTDAAPVHAPLFRLAEELTFGALNGLYRYNVLKTRPKDGRPDPANAPDPLWLAMLCKDIFVPEELRAATRRGEAAATGVRLARNLVNGPGNAVTPAFLADEARKIARRGGFACEVLDRAELEKLGMGALLAVAEGSAQAPCCIVLEHVPAGCEDERPLVVVGKGVTFDTGGICLKPAQNMRDMKGDMAGAAAVLGLFEALGEMKLPRRVVGILPCAENMPGSRATRPGDVVVTLAGKTVEIVNTDAEGRLLLCDALTYAQRRFTPDALIDVATLTGACVVALGQEVAGLFSDDPLLAERIRGLGERVGEWFWPLPVWDCYFEQLKSDTADFANAGSREGGACMAAIFLRQFVEPGVRWAHLDIAGPGFAPRKTETRPSGGTGFAVRTLLDLAAQGLPA